MSSIRVSIVLCLVFVAVILAAFVYSVVRTPVLSLQQLQGQGVFVFPEPRPLTAFALHTDAGEPFSAASFEGKWSFVFFGFTNCPGICPTTMAVMGEADRRLSRAASAGSAAEVTQWETFHGIMVSVDPLRDDAARLGEYVRGFSQRFVGLRGTREEVARLSGQLGIAFGNVPAADDGYEVEHSGQIVVIDPEARYHAFIKAPHSADKIIAAYRSLDAAF